MNALMAMLEKDNNTSLKRPSERLSDASLSTLQQMLNAKRMKFEYGAAAGSCGGPLLSSLRQSDSSKASESAEARQPFEQPEDDKLNRFMAQLPVIDSNVAMDDHMQKSHQAAAANGGAAPPQMGDGSEHSNCLAEIIKMVAEAEKSSRPAAVECASSSSLSGKSGDASAENANDGNATQGAADGSKKNPMLEKALTMFLSSGNRASSVPANGVSSGCSSPTSSELPRARNPASAIPSRLQHMIAANNSIERASSSPAAVKAMADEQGAASPLKSNNSLPAGGKPAARGSSVLKTDTMTEEDWLPRICKRGDSSDKSSKAIKERSMAERHRRERISEGLQKLRVVVRGQGDTATMLDSAVNYVEALQRRVASLEATLLLHQAMCPMGTQPLKSLQQPAGSQHTMTAQPTFLGASSHLFKEGHMHL